ncbi:ribonuclease HII [Hahella sp. CCB-MM4]|uniref:ribonuclease HII n=1 Tax=Hahella sp. (strain CCB-MM4) TaxID=1926491 RepID=UPI000B9B36A8|nr:ribonuclease HII [Hahella sp. CCB-MM4]OZG70473.1 ribonuclease HII [Hahella sp. CCB-MM4]
MTESQISLFDNFKTGTMLIAGVDEVGRGPLAGPVVAAAVILDPENPIAGLKDSKKLTHEKRLFLRDEIKEKALAWATAWCTVEEIDDINILQASLLAMKRAVEKLEPAAEYAQIDGNKLPKLAIPAEAIVKGDSKVAAISAASILAKVERDLEMERLDAVYPGYGLAVHKGYPTAQHLSALKTLGVSEIHRRSYKPVREMLNNL